MGLDNHKPRELRLHTRVIFDFLARSSKDLNFGILDLLRTISAPEHVVTHYGCQLKRLPDPAEHDRANRLASELDCPDYLTYYELIEASENERYATRIAAAIRAAVQGEFDAGLYDT
jgi:hypothetical protein